jgi:hypothetical protein
LARSPFEHSGDVLIWSVCDKREVSCSLLGFPDDRCETPVKLSTLTQWRHAIRGRSEQRMCECDPVSRDHNDVGVNRSLERSHTVIHDRVDQARGRSRESSHRGEGSARWISKSGESVRNEGEQLVRKRQRCAVIDLASTTHEGTPQLEGKKRIATRSLMNAAHQRARQRNPQSRSDHLVECTHAERPYGQAFNPDGIECAIEVDRTRRRPSLLQPPREQKSDRLFTQAPNSERERCCGRSV